MVMQNALSRLRWRSQPSGGSPDALGLLELAPVGSGVLERRPRDGILGWMTTTDHKKIALMTLLTSISLFIVFGALALIMRTQLAQPDQHLIGIKTYNELFTLHGSGMIYLVITPLAIGLGVYLVPLQVGAPTIAAPRVCLFSYWLYVCGGACILFSPIFSGPMDGWYSLTPLSDSTYSPGLGMDFWVFGAALSVGAMMLMSSCVLWTALRMRVPGMSLLRIPIFTWSQIVTGLMTVGSFPMLIAAMSVIGISRVDPSLFTHNNWNEAYLYLFWFYGHPVVYVMFFPFVGAIAEVIATFARRRYFGYSFTVYSLLAFAAGSMTVYGHHLFTTGETVNNFFSLSSISLLVPAGIEYFGLLGTLLGGQLSYPPPMLFALAFIPQFLVGGLTGIMIATPVLDYHFHGSYFIVAHFHYTLFAGSVFGAFAGIYFWFSKFTGRQLQDRLGRVHFVLMVIGTNAAFLPMFYDGYEGMPRRVMTYTERALSIPNAISTAGAFLIAIGVGVFLYNVYITLRHAPPAGPDPWHAGQTLEWATSSPPPLFNFDAEHPIPRITSHAPLHDLRIAHGMEPDEGQSEPS